MRHRRPVDFRDAAQNALFHLLPTGYAHPPQKRPRHLAEESLDHDVRGHSDSVAGGTWDGRESGTIAAEELVEQAGFAGVGPADDGRATIPPPRKGQLPLDFARAPSPVPLCGNNSGMQVSSLLTHPWRADKGSP